MAEKKQVTLHWEVAVMTFGIVFASVTCQWFRLQFITQGAILLPVTKEYSLLLVVLVVLELVNVIVFSRSLSTDSNGKSYEGFVLSAIFHTQWTFLSVITLSTQSPLQSDIFECFGPLISLILFRICNAKLPAYIEICGCILVTIGSILLSENILQAAKSPTVTLLTSISFMARNESIKQLSYSGIKLEFQTRTLCSCLAISMFVFFLLGILFDNAFVSFFLIGAFAFLTSSLFSYLTWEFISKNNSILYLAMLSILSDLISNYAVLNKHHLTPQFVNVCGAIFFLLGVYCLVNRTKSAKDVKFHYERVNKNEVYTRMEFLLFICDVVGIFVYFLHPRVSHRDFKNITSFGMDNLVSWIKQQFKTQ